MQDYTLIITGDIDLEAYKKVLEFMKKLRIIDVVKERKKLTIIINSFGGNVNCAFAIYDLLAMCNFDITTIAVGCCECIATILFLLGNKRYITANSTITLYSRGYINEVDEKIIKCYLNSYNFKMSKSELRDIFISGKNYSYSALQAIEKGFATDIITDISQIL